MAGSVVVPDFDITFIEKSLYSIYVIISFIYLVDILFPTKTTSVFWLSLFLTKPSITAFAPKYDPPIPITTKTLDSFCIFSFAFNILSNSFLSYLSGKNIHPTILLLLFASFSNCLSYFIIISLYSIILCSLNFDLEKSNLIIEYFLSKLSFVLIIFSYYFFSISCYYNFFICWNYPHLSF